MDGGGLWGFITQKRGKHGHLLSDQSPNSFLGGSFLLVGLWPQLTSPSSELQKPLEALKREKALKSCRKLSFES